MALKLTREQIPDNSILDLNNKQTYLGNTFVASVPTTLTVGTTETPVMLLSNPATNLVSMFNFIRKMSCLTASQSIVFKVYANPTVTTAGTVITPVNLRINSASPASQMSVSYSPTISANGTVMTALPSLAFAANVSNVLLMVDPGNSLLVTATASAAATALEIEQIWYEL